MKRCPSCNRTYSDESISFCLADGSLLSAPYDSLGPEAPPTEVLNSPRLEVPPTQPARPAASTMTSLPGAHRYEAAGVDTATRKRSPLLWVAVVLPLAMIVVGVLTVRHFVNRDGETIANAPAQASPAQAFPAPASPAQVPRAQAPPVQAMPNPTPTPLIVKPT